VSRGREWYREFVEQDHEHGESVEGEVNEENEEEEPMKDTKIHLCNTCKSKIPTCNAIYEDIEYGNGWGNDNVMGCKCYEPKSKDKEENNDKN